SRAPPPFPTRRSSDLFMTIWCFIDKQSVIQAYFYFNSMLNRNPMQGACYFTFRSFTSTSTSTVFIISYMNFGDIPFSIFYNTFRSEEHTSELQSRENL